MSSLLVLTNWGYNDPLIQSYTLPYLNIIQKNNPSARIFLLTLESKKDYQIKNISGIFIIPYRYYHFGLRASIQWVYIMISLLLKIFTKNIRVIHCMGTPAGLIGYILSFTTGRKLIVDSFEPHAEAMVENGTWKKNNLAYRILFLFEKLQARKAFAVIAATQSMKEYSENKYKTSIKNFFYKPACINFDFFCPRSISQTMLNKYNINTNSIVCIYAGKIGGIYLKDEIFDFIDMCYKYWGDRFKIIFLPSNSTEEEISALLKKKRIPQNICFIENTTHSNIPDYLNIADFALNPVKPVPSKKYCTSLKDGEYWAMGLPIVITKDISDDSRIIKDNDIGAVLNSLDSSSYAYAIKKIDSLLKSINKTDLKNKIRNIGLLYRNFSIAEKVYSEIYNKNNLLSK